jgi:hypothetical protein
MLHSRKESFYENVKSTKQSKLKKIKLQSEIARKIADIRKQTGSKISLLQCAGGSHL